MTTDTDLGNYPDRNALDHDTAMLLNELRSELIARDVEWHTATAAVRRVARSRNWS